MSSNGCGSGIKVSLVEDKKYITIKTSNPQIFFYSILEADIYSPDKVFILNLLKASTPVFSLS